RDSARVLIVFLIAPKKKCPRHFFYSASWRDEASDQGRARKIHIIEIDFFTALVRTVRKPESGFRQKSGRRDTGTLLGTAHQHRFQDRRPVFSFTMFFQIQVFTLDGVIAKN